MVRRLAAALIAPVLLAAGLAVPAVAHAEPRTDPVVSPSSLTVADGAGEELASVPVDGVDPAAVRERSAFADAQGESASAADPGTEPVDPDDVVALGARTFTGPFLVAGVTWDAGQDVDVTQVAVRVREAGTWTTWQALDVVETGVKGERPGTEPLITAGADAAQVRVATADGVVVPAGLRLDVVETGEPPASTPAASPTATPTPTPTVNPTPKATPPTTGTAATKRYTGDVLRPTIVTRAQWGANEKRGSAWPEVSGSLAAMYLHHTAGTNSYTKAQSAAIVRGIYAFHTGSRGWPDIGYQFLVDRFGTIYQGRRDAILDLPVGAQAGGYNTGTIGVSAMGNFQDGNPPAVMVASIEKVFAWEAYAHGLNPTGKTTLTTGTSTGSGTRAKGGTKVTVPVILGHRDTNYTACPGWRLWEKLPAIRKEVKKQVDAAIAKYGEPVDALAAPKPTAPSSVQAPVQWSASSTFRWAPVKGAVKYQVLSRSSGLTYAMDDPRSWRVIKTVKSTSAALETDSGRTRVVGVRGIDASGRRGSIAIVGQVTRPVDWSLVSRSASWKRSTSLGFATYRTTAVHAMLAVAAVKQAKAVVLEVVPGTTPGKVEVRQGSTTLRTIAVPAATTTGRVVVRADLPRSTSGRITLRTASGSGPVRVAAVAFPRVAVGTRAIGVGTLPPAAPVRVALTSSQAPFREATSSTYRWKPNAIATKYEVLVRTAAHGSALPSGWTKVASTTGTSYTQSMVPTGRTWVVGVRTVGKGGTSAISAFPAATRPVASAKVAHTGWVTRYDDKWFRGQVWSTASKGRALSVTNAKSVRAVRLILHAAPGRGRVKLTIGSTTIATVSTAAGVATAHRHVDVKLPRAMSGTLKVTTVDHKPVRISALVLAR